MSLFQDLISASSSKNSLEKYIDENINNIAEFSHRGRTEQEAEIDVFEEFVLLQLQTIRQLDYANSNNKAFAYYLMDYCLRFRSESAFIQLYQIIQNNDLVVGSRLEAAMQYLYNVADNDVFIERFDSICEKLQMAINTEEDNEVSSVKTFLNYYSYVWSINPDYAAQIRLRYKDAIKNERYTFLKSPIIDSFLSPTSLDVGRLDDYIYSPNEKTIFGFTGSINGQYGPPLVEERTSYAELLACIPAKFKEVRSLAIRLIDESVDADEIFESLGRGTAILSNEQQLFHYLKSYGRMHEAKLISALDGFPFDDLDGCDIGIYDWGCGQGIASMVFKEYADKQDVSIDYNRVVLIEPSMIALKRAALHVRRFYGDCDLRTVAKDLDSVGINDISGDDSDVKIHLLSNVLDMDTFSLPQLIGLIKRLQKGINYFICVSPYITDARTNRLDRFVSAFRGCSGFENICDIDDMNDEWINGWTRVVRVFKVTL